MASVFRYAYKITNRSATDNIMYDGSEKRFLGMSGFQKDWFIGITAIPSGIFDFGMNLRA